MKTRFESLTKKVIQLQQKHMEYQKSINNISSTFNKVNSYLEQFYKCKYTKKSSYNISTNTYKRNNIGIDLTSSEDDNDSVYVKYYIVSIETPE